MNISFRRSSTNVTPDKPKDREESDDKKNIFGDMGRFTKKIFQDKDKDEAKLKRSKSNAGDDSTNTRMKEIMTLLEEFRLQCPPTHAGLVVAFTATNLSPLSDPDIKYKWYRMDKQQDQFLQIDQGPRAWYPPTADDIGKVICAQCEDVFEQGYCRYAETGPVEADPLLRSMLDSALENGSYAMKDASVSLGVNTLDPEVNAMVVSFDMQAKHRFSALEQSPSPVGAGGFVQFEGRVEAEVSREGIFLSFAEGEGTIAGGFSRKGLLIKNSTSISVQCMLPASLVIAVALPSAPPAPPALALPAAVEADDASAAEAKPEEEAAGEPVAAAASADAAEGGEENNEQKDPELKETETETEGAVSSESGGAEGAAAVLKPAASPRTSPRSSDAAAPGSPAPSSPSAAAEDEASQPWAWVGERSGEQYKQVVAFFANVGTCVVPEFRVCLACGDRMQRDAMALSIRALAALAPEAGMRARMSALPWAGMASAAGAVHSMAGSELGSRLKDLENENKQVKRERDELNLQLLEHHHEGGGGGSSHERTSSGDGDEGEELASAARAKIRSLENEILTSRRKEMEVEQSSLEKDAQLSRLAAEKDAQDKVVVDLQERLGGRQRALAESEAAALELRAQVDGMEADMRSVGKDKAETKKARATLREMENEMVSVRKAQQEAEARYDGQIAETRLIAAELLAAQTEAAARAQEARRSVDRCAELEAELCAERAGLAGLRLEHAALLAEKKALQEAAQTAEMYEEALDSIDKLEGMYSYRCSYRCSYLSI
jgi:hypothetical protein